MRRKARKIKLGNLYIGGDAPISIQSMTTKDTSLYSQVIDEIKDLEKIGCDIIRVSVPNMKSAKVLHKIKENISIPLVADIHFDYKLAIESMLQGVDGLRLNPGNLKREDKIEDIVFLAKQKKIPIRVGVNGGSIDRKKYSVVNSDNIVSSALEHIKILERFEFYDIKISLKATNVLMTIESYEKMSKIKDYPFHLGITEAGSLFSGSIKSSVGLGILLYKGIGDTIRVSLTADPREEVRLAKEILNSLNLYSKEKVEIISCPTCGRCEIDLINITNKVEKATESIHKKMKVAIMGCIVNGPGESIEADIGISGVKGKGILYKKGEKIKKVDEEKIVDTLIDEIKRY